MSFAESGLDAPLRSLFGAGAVPGDFGWCATTGVSNTCGAPHTDEYLADVELTYAMPATVTARCAALIAQVTRMPGVTAGGRLRVMSPVVHYDAWGNRSSGDPTSSTESATATGGVRATGGGRLTSTLIGLGGASLPLA